MVHSMQTDSNSFNNVLSGSMGNTVVDLLIQPEHQLHPAKSPLASPLHSVREYDHPSEMREDSALQHSPSHASDEIILSEDMDVSGMLIFYRWFRRISTVLSLLWIVFIFLRRRSVVRITSGL